MLIGGLFPGQGIVNIGSKRPSAAAGIRNPISLMTATSFRLGTGILEPRCAFLVEWLDLESWQAGCDHARGRYLALTPA
jgi:hypothetical protein